MQLLIDEIRDLTQALAGLRPDSIVVDNLNGILARLKTSDIEHKMAGYKSALPISPEDEQAMEKHKEFMKDQADLLNKEADHFLDELERIKTMRHTLNLEALDPIIKEARRIIHSIHGFTAWLQD
jgi:translation initiation factor 2B subunit (eIF-2B alpha/beta/delta family)